MSYISVDDVLLEFKALTVNASTAITSAKIQQYITTEEAVINGKIAGLYSVPIAASASISFSIMQGLALAAVRARILPIVAVKTGKDDLDQGGASDLREYVKETLDMIRNREMILVDATLVDANGGIDSYNVDESVEAVFDKDVEQW